MGGGELEGGGSNPACRAEAWVGSPLLERGAGWEPAVRWTPWPGCHNNPSGAEEGGSLKFIFSALVALTTGRARLVTAEHLGVLETGRGLLAGL